MLLVVYPTALKKVICALHKEFFAARQQSDSTKSVISSDSYRVRNGVEKNGGGEKEK